ncbi:hypothetical protein C8N43_1204 [Litoreibacter ponti]|uniref:Uncharacterized protein n=1 Tax=Litoreibacter ponti TaxID=1510457 RepID=A0A2T6BKG2_9RHOB|nr:hypothetical protein C8N43_1204 [Litoreibacter ponti]
MMQPAVRRAVIFGLLALFLAPIVILGVSPADRVHGLAGPFAGAGGAAPAGGMQP